jgi:hypothetical protein
MQVRRVCFVGTRTASFDATVACFRDVLGFEQAFTNPGWGRWTGRVPTARSPAEPGNGRALSTSIGWPASWPRERCCSSTSATTTSGVTGTCRVRRIFRSSACARPPTCFRPFPIVTACSGGPRAAAAASALRRLGHRNIWRLADGGVSDLLARPLGLDLLGVA